MLCDIWEHGNYVSRELHNLSAMPIMAENYESDDVSVKLREYDF